MSRQVAERSTVKRPRKSIRRPEEPTKHQTDLVTLARVYRPTRGNVANAPMTVTLGSLVLALREQRWN